MSNQANEDGLIPAEQSIQDWVGDYQPYEVPDEEDE